MAEGIQILQALSLVSKSNTHGTTSLRTDSRAVCSTPRSRHGILAAITSSSCLRHIGGSSQVYAAWSERGCQISAPSPPSDEPASHGLATREMRALYWIQGIPFMRWLVAQRGHQGTIRGHAYRRAQYNGARPSLDIRCMIFTLNRTGNKTNMVARNTWMLGRC